MSDEIMALRQQLKNRLKKIPPGQIARKLGYSHSDKLDRRMKLMLSDPLLGLASGSFDGHYGGREFLNQLLIVTGLDSSETRRQLNEIETQARDQNFGFQPWIFVETNFKRKGESILMLALLEARRRIKVSKKIKRLPLQQQVEMLSEIVKKHYSSLSRDGNGERCLAVWGPVDHYICHLEADKAIALSPDGYLLWGTETIKSHEGAWLSF